MDITSNERFAKTKTILAAGYDDILGVIGPFGLWQKRTTAFLWVIIAFIGIPFLVYSFALAKPGTFYEYFKMLHLV